MVNRLTVSQRGSRLLACSIYPAIIARTCSSAASSAMERSAMPCSLAQPPISSASRATRAVQYGRPSP
jgi:hypothetical protein